MKSFVYKRKAAFNCKSCNHTASPSKEGRKFASKCSLKLTLIGVEHNQLEHQPSPTQKYVATQMATFNTIQLMQKQRPMRRIQNKAHHQVS